MGADFAYRNVGLLRYSRRHWWFSTTSCFGVTNHSEAASLWSVRQDRATIINSGSPPSCDVTFWHWSVASPSEMGWLASKVSRYLSILCLWCRAGSTPPPAFGRLTDAVALLPISLTDWLCLFASKHTHTIIGFLWSLLLLAVSILCIFQHTYRFGFRVTVSALWALLVLYTYFCCCRFTCFYK